VTGRLQFCPYAVAIAGLRLEWQDAALVSRQIVEMTQGMTKTQKEELTCLL
jgi:hypothetical protein